MSNIEIRAIISRNRFRHFEIAEKMGITEFSFSRMLRKELTEEQRKRVLKAIEELRAEEAKRWNN